MAHSFNKIWIHAIWATKNRAPIIQKSFEVQLYHYIRRQFEEQECPLRVINGMPDHLHCLFLLNAQKAVAAVIKQVKGSSSHFVNQNNLCTERFAWQTGYAAYSVSESAVTKVKAYIKNQKAHHQKKSFQEEYQAFLSLYGLEKN